MLKRFVRNFRSSACSGQAVNKWGALNHVQVQLIFASVNGCAHQQPYEGQAESTVCQSGRDLGGQFFQHVPEREQLGLQGLHCMLQA